MTWEPAPVSWRPLPAHGYDCSARIRADQVSLSHAVAPEPELPRTTCSFRSRSETQGSPVEVSLANAELDEEPEQIALGLNEGGSNPVVLERQRSSDRRR